MENRNIEVGDIISKINNKYAISRTTYNKVNSQGL